MLFMRGRLPFTIWRNCRVASLGSAAAPAALLLLLLLHLAVAPDPAQRYCILCVFLRPEALFLPFCDVECNPVSVQRVHKHYNPESQIWRPSA
jgi:hypothetical protein